MGLTTSAGNDHHERICARGSTHMCVATMPDLTRRQGYPAPILSAVKSRARIMAECSYTRTHLSESVEQAIVLIFSDTSGLVPVGSFPPSFPQESSVMSPLSFAYHMMIC